ncbi:MAG: response regulator transcription factor [Chloroflexi bacterium]|nr:response regulator transcription factor [Chloroflexota bacterium]
MKILVADDDRELGEILTFALQRAGFDVVKAEDGEQALRLFGESDPALVILDYNMPKLDGLQVCRNLRTHSAVPIIMLTVRNAEEDILSAFEAGADDYVSKPFSPKQLIARIKAELRRAGLPQRGILTSGSLTLDPVRHEVRQSGAGAISLTPLEFRLLHVLIENRGQVLTVDDLVHQVWGHDETTGDRTLLKGLVRRLRQKIDLDGVTQSRIKTVVGVGYTYTDPGA